ncbi:N5-carboxyaminoimidazole ribonucleotide synthase [Rubripirellula lacrimiformis]|uniref:N5-carboxyaminoimidazole ribonucleotide synthase n=1 Tax=Rubripirellula lacrimiformis TaxID=1930273 RepID=A0A517NDX2_9BACT|nr:5-(carboxyamino)imidazole ribonucleotide synthase [Rubripirellula lacrimiformis]QDT05258.1 N5-carboxyaminoimidazole ribonucleotide synthase [Rubripirellula lacrimiformis]
MKTILPGSTIGMVGGGQLGRMFAMAAASMGYDVVIFCESVDTPAAQVASRSVVGKLDDIEAIDAFASQCNVITLEFENIPAETIHRCSQYAATYPSAAVLAAAQDRLIEKSTLRDAGLPVTPFAEVHDAASLVSAADTLGWPLVVKTARSGYDGKGQHKVETAADADQVPWETFDSWIAEKWVPFDCEVSVVVARRADGVSETFPVFENSHANHVLDVSVVPTSVSDAVADKARQIADAAARHLDVVGILCVEFFVAGDEVMINEVAPRPHNSAHLTIEACHTSQFEQHVRAVCGLPLGSTEIRCGAAAMANLLGDVWPTDAGTPPWDQSLADPAASLHLYGKREAKTGRKMGHITVTAPTAQEAKQRVIAARDNLTS